MMLVRQKAVRWDCLSFRSIGAPGMIRTCDPLIRSQVLYPTELRVRGTLNIGSGNESVKRGFLSSLSCEFRVPRCLVNEREHLQIPGTRNSELETLNSKLPSGRSTPVLCGRSVPDALPQP